MMYQERTDNMKKLFPDPPVLPGGRLCLKPLSLSDTDSLRRLTREEPVYRYLPTFLFEKKYEQPEDVILRLYDEGLEDSLILGIFMGERFCGLAEVYSYRAPIHKASVGYRLLREEWGKGIATEALKILTAELLKRGIEIITASTMLENHASAHVLQKNDFTLVNHAVEEDWGYPQRRLRTNGSDRAGKLLYLSGQNCLMRQNRYFHTRRNHVGCCTGLLNICRQAVPD